MPPKIITLSGHVGFDITASIVRKSLAAAKGKDVEIEIASPGGFVSVGLEIFNLIRDYPGNVDFKAMGTVASAGSYILMARQGRGKIRTHDNAMFMIHTAMSGGLGNADFLEKIVNHLRGINKIYANAYSAMSGISHNEIMQLMKDETFYYGAEIVEAGFADEVIETKSGNKDRASAMISAVAEIENCVAMMKESEAAKEDITKAAAFLGKTFFKGNEYKESKAIRSEMIKNGIDENHKKEVITMTLKELLAANSGAKAEYDQAILRAQSDGAKVKQESMQVNLDKIAPIIASEKYPAAIRNLASEVMQGKEDYAALKGAVTMFDATQEAAASTAAAGETGEAGETPPKKGDETVAAEDGSISNETDHAAMVTRIKEAI